NVAAKGSPEAIAQMCGLQSGDAGTLFREAGRFAEEGLRVLGVARADWPAVELPEQAGGFPWRYLGLIALADPVKPAVPAAVKQCREAGVRVVMITGDFPGTARSIAEQSGIDSAVCLTGTELAGMSDEALGRRIGGIGVFARTVPEQKLRLVNAL